MTTKTDTLADAILEWTRSRDDLVLWETPDGPTTLAGIWRVVVPTPRVKNQEGFQPHEYLHKLVVGQAVFIDVAVKEDGWPKPGSAVRRERIEQAGGLWIVARSVADVEAVLGGDHGRGPDRGGDYDPIPGWR